MLDTSGAMRSRLGDAEAIAVARDFVRALRDELASGGSTPPLGLRLYGASSAPPARACGETRLAVRPGDAAGDVVAALATLQPQGVAPLAFALESALADTARTYVLVTAGPDTCGGDACAVWREAVRQRTNRAARIHVVALGIQSQDADELRCVSRAGSGSFLAIRDRSEVAAAARRLALILRNQGQLDVKLSLRGSETFTAPVRLLVPRTRKVVAAFTARGPRAVPAGIYDVVIETSPPIRIERVMVLPGETVTIERSDFGRLDVEMRDSEDQPVRAPLSIHAPGRRTDVRYGSTGEPLVLQSGTYDVTVDLGDSIAARRGIVVSSGRTTHVTLGGRGTVRVVSPEFPDPPPTRAILVQGAAADTMVLGQSTSLPAGRYRLRVETLPAYVGDVSVEAGESTTIELPPLGLLRLEVSGADGPIAGVPAWVLEPNTLERYGTITSGERRLLMPGIFRLDLSTAPPQTVGDVAVRPGEETVIAPRGFGRITVVPPEGAGASTYRLEVLPEPGARRLAQRIGPAPVVAALPGTYYARVWRGSALVWEGRITVASDKPARIDLPRP